MKILNSRAWSFAIVAAIYAVAAAAGTVSYIFIPLREMWLKLLVADVIATVITFAFSVIFKNASVYDPYWSVQPIVITLALAIVEIQRNTALMESGEALQPLGATQVIMLAVIIIWGVRLTANWAYTFKGLTHQDWRYTMLRETTGKLYPLVNFAGIHMVPTLIVYACTLPAVYVISDAPPFNIGSVIFCFVSLAAVILQGAADFEMHKFKKSGGSGFIRTGLWKHSRHPNYLGEITMWWGIALAAVCTLPEMWYLILGAFANTLLFLFVSIPLADKHQSRKDGFAEYKAQTRMLLPIKRFK